MIDKVKTILTIFLVLILAFAVIYSIVRIISSAFEKPILLNSGKLEEYINDENLVLSYSTFYYVEDCLENFIEGCNREKYDELYRLYIEDYKVQFSKDEIISKLKDFKLSDNSYKLKAIYTINDKYLLNIQVNDEIEYIIFTFVNTKDFDYYFAFLK